MKERLKRQCYARCSDEKQQEHDEVRDEKVGEEEARCCAYNFVYPSTEFLYPGW